MSAINQPCKLQKHFQNVIADLLRTHSEDILIILAQLGVRNLYVRIILIVAAACLEPYYSDIVDWVSEVIAGSEGGGCDSPPGSVQCCPSYGVSVASHDSVHVGPDYVF
ncbi:MAG: hypothetical protein AB1744_05985 [Candidatus Zixiibacteriota bacterium]